MHLQRICSMHRGPSGQPHHRGGPGGSSTTSGWSGALKLPCCSKLSRASVESSGCHSNSSRKPSTIALVGHTRTSRSRVPTFTPYPGCLLQPNCWAARKPINVSADKVEGLLLHTADGHHQANTGRAGKALGSSEEALVN